MSRIEEYRDLVQITVKDVTWIGTVISDDRQSIDIKISFGNQCVTIPIRVEDIEKNVRSTKTFLRLVIDPLEALLRGKI